MTAESSNVACRCCFFSPQILLPCLSIGLHSKLRWQWDFNAALCRRRTDVALKFTQFWPECQPQFADKGDCRQRRSQKQLTIVCGRRDFATRWPRFFTPKHGNRFKSHIKLLLFTEWEPNFECKKFQSICVDCIECNLIMCDFKTQFRLNCHVSF